MKANRITNLRLSDLELLSLVDKGASGDDSLRPRIMLVKRAEEPRMADLAKRALGEILAEMMSAGKFEGLSEDDMAVLTLAIGQEPEQPASDPEPVEAAEKADDEEKEEEEKATEKAEDEEEEEEKKEVAKSSEPDLEWVKRNAELEKRIGQLELEKRHAELIVKVRQEYAFCPGGSTEEIAKVLASAEQSMDADSFGALSTMLKAASATIEQSGLLKAAGSDRDAPSGGAAQQLKAIAEDIKKADSTLSRQQAMREAGARNPQIYANYIAERGAN